MLSYQLETENGNFGTKILEESMKLCIESAKSRVKMALQYSKLLKRKDSTLERLFNSFETKGKPSDEVNTCYSCKKRDIKEESKLENSTQMESYFEPDPERPVACRDFHGKRGCIQHNCHFIHINKYKD